MTTNQELRKLAEEALRTQTQYTIWPNIARMNAAKAAKDALLDRIDRLEADGPVMRRGTSGDGSAWMGTMRECLEDYRQAAAVEASERRRLGAENEAQRNLLERARECADISNIVLAKVDPSGDEASDDILDETMAMNRKLHAAITQHLKGTP